ncbi:NAD(P)-dependent oxidoreductase [Mycolicibacterium komossense]|uniref:NAD(P)-dependent oxidoreductase n=1 Tax=Mycolicibacterium komossense TaxID=1779 RepID=A0ABT3CAU8_9MYCO|nr:NAD(P)-dependent oxidoreductase [Mycolicibacterium komossense]MCV7226381.1 NAD(P)-dependent oxidoreductase [Mycolicibacterium komossense]
MTRIGFIGAGRLGAPMVRRLIGAGHQVGVLGRSDEKCSAIAELGATAVTTLQEAADRAEVVVVCAFTDEQVRQVCLTAGLITAMAPKSALVLHTTGSPRTAEAIAARGQALGVDVVDAPVSGGPHDIAAGHVTIFAGGGDDALARVTPVLAAYGDPILHIGPVGAGQRVKLVNNTLFAGQIGLLVEAVRLARSLGVPETALLAALPHGSGASRALSGVATRGSVEQFIDTAGSFIAKDVEVVRKISAELGADLGVLDDVVSTWLGST